MKYYSVRHQERIEGRQAAKWLEFSYKVGVMSLVFLGYYLIILLALSRSM